MSISDEDHSSDRECLYSSETDSSIVMAEQSAHDVVNQPRSAGDASPSDVTANKTNEPTTVGSVEDLQRSTTNDKAQNHVSAPEAATIDATDRTNRGSEDRGPGDLNTEKLPYLNHDSDAVDGPQSDGELQRGDSTEHNRLHHTVVDGSAGSDTDTSKADSAKDGLSDSRGHVRSNSVKRPTSFKAVSVTRSFLAKAAAGSAPATKAGDKASGSLAGQSSQPAPRPRLVAKSGSGLRDSSPRSASVVNESGRGTGPDPSKVWNKNRPVQPPPPKQFTDEELKQQYGIHLATRLQGDDAGKESKWADIDDDEDDWAPEEIEWNDGTKTSLQHTEEQAALADQELSSSPKDRMVEVDKASPPPTQQPRPVGPNPTILKVGAPVTGHTKTGSLILKGAAEKPTLVAKPSAPSPVKSPWAPLPPVEKVSPVPINPPRPQQPTPRLQQRNPHGFDTMPRATSPAKEIAADDFNRSWRDSSTANRELYNSHSGRYEPVNEVRRGSIRNEQGPRQPAVLQRPHSDQQGPAEPSAAFQTSRNAVHQEGSWGRRRTSSNVSGVSGGFGRRMSFGKPTDLPHDGAMQHRRGSQATESAISPSGFSPQLAQHPQLARGYSPSRPNQHQSWQQHQSPNLSNAHPVSNHATSTPGVSPQLQQAELVKPDHDPNAQALEQIAHQQNFMKERRELAMRRRKEEEAKEEAARRERIRLKMEALGMLDEKKDPSKDQATAESEPSKETATVGSPPKPPMPESLGEIKQYGMMKVHQPQPVRKVSPMAVADHGSDSSPTEHALSPAKPAKLEPTVATDKPIQNGTIAPQTDDRHISPAARAGPHNQNHVQRDQSWKHVPSAPNNYSGWSGGMTTHSTAGGNLWGPPNSDKALGNGTFNRDFSAISSGQVSQTQIPASVPGPIRPPAAVSRPQVADGFRPVDEPKAPVAPIAVSRPGPIAPPTAPSDPLRPRNQISSWKNLPAQLARDDAEARELSDKQYAARMEEETRTGKKRDLPQPTFKETWRQVNVNEAMGRRSIVNVSKTATEEQGVAPANQPILPTQAVSQAVSQAVQYPQAPVNKPGSSVMTPRGSRFFPHAGDSPQAPNGPAAIAHTYTSPASPPPPDSTSHPAYEGDVSHPLVSLPMLKPKPIVKLPPAAIAPIAPPRAAPAAGQIESLRTVPQPIAKTSSWQDRFNGLLGRVPQVNQAVTPQTPKSYALAVSPAPANSSVLAVSSASKAPLDDTSAQLSATVSLPKHEEIQYRSPYGFLLDDSSDAISRVTEEPLFEEHRELGSKPIVRLPNKAPENAWQPAMAPPNSRPKSKFQHQHKPQVLSVEPFLFSLQDKENQTPQGIIISVRLPGADSTKSHVMTRRPNSSRQSSRPRNSSAGFRKKQPMRPKEGLGNVPSQRSASSGSPRPPMQPGSTRSNLGSGNWNRRVSGVAQ
ncbi:MAG: hypothetical protein M1819_001189 [Sarea resinae]|nr:MAG: hypothetical protein M1819_001189 [Sarea resinae]